MTECHYTVGKDNEGATVLKVGSDFTSTMTMGESAVIQLIRLLAATLETYTVTVVQND
jgi:hypothetical protein